MTGRNAALSQLFSPRSVALIGASDKSAWSRSIFNRFGEYNYAGALYAVNRSGVSAHGLKGFTCCRDIPSPVDLAFIFVPAVAVIDAIHDAASAGIRCVVVLSSGFAEAGPEGAALQLQLAETARLLDVTLLGPNSLGFANIAACAVATNIGYRAPMRLGGLALVSQSGAVANEMAKFAHQQGIGLSFIGATGNEAMITAVDMIDFLIDDPATKAIAAYVESIKTPDEFRAVALRALEARKPIVMLKVGSSEVSASVAQAHTGAFVGDDRLFTAFCHQYGVIRVRSLDEMIITASLIERTGPLEPPGVALLSVSGGACGQFADLAAINAVPLPPLAQETVAKLREVLPAFAVPLNPLDVTGVVLQDPTIWGKALKPLVEDPSIGLVLTVMNIPGSATEMNSSRQHWPIIAEAYRALGREPFLMSQVVQPFDRFAEEVSELSGLKNIVYGMEFGTRALGHLARWSNCIARPRAPASIVLGPQPDSLPRGEREALLHVSRFGVEVIPAILATNREQARAAAAALGDRVALKIASHDILHKTELGGVRLSIAGDEVGNAFDSIIAAVRTSAPKAQIEGVLVSPMRNTGIEMFVGVAMDPQWGLAIVVGLGGIWIEALDDAALRLLPIDCSIAREMLDELRGSRLLKGFRGAPTADLGRLAAAIVQIGEAALALGPGLRSLEINPLLVDGDRIEGLDALIVGVDEITDSGAELR